jgi:hypothetical protein
LVMVDMRALTIPNNALILFFLKIVIGKIWDPFETW